MSYYLTAFIENGTPIITKGSQGGYRFSIQLSSKNGIIQKSIQKTARNLDFEIKEYENRLLIVGIKDIYKALSNTHQENLLKIPKWFRFIRIIQMRHNELLDNEKARYTLNEEKLIQEFFNLKNN